MMKKAITIGMTMFLLLAGNSVQAQICQIANGSFEDDGSINNISIQEPNGWDVNIPASKFFGYVNTDWPTDVNSEYNLTLYAESWNTFTASDMATVSQDMNLTDVNEIIFDLKLENFGFEWDPNICNAVLLIDDDVVWQSSTESSDVRGEYFNQAYSIEDKYRDGQLHKLSLGIRVNVDEMLFERYFTYWDSIECTVFCDGWGLLAGDFNQDCFVDIYDLELFADVWLTDIEPYSRYNLFRGDDTEQNAIANFYDLTIFADNWLRSSLEQE
jgi:hypothetical protein